MKDSSKRRQTSSILDQINEQPVSNSSYGGIVQDDTFFQAIDETYQGDSSQLRQQVEVLQAQIDNAIVPVNDGTIAFKRFRLTPTSLLHPDNVDEAELIDLGSMLARIESGTQFWMGDWANLYISIVNASNQYELNEAYDLLAERFSIDKNTLKNYAWVCRRIDASLRSDALSFSHHVLAASERYSEHAGYLLKHASEQGLSVAEFRKFLSEFIADPHQEDEPDWLFSKDRLPKIGTSVQKLWAKARNGDKKSAKKLMAEIDKIRRWADEIESSIR